MGESQLGRVHPQRPRPAETAGSPWRHPARGLRSMRGRAGRSPWLRHGSSRPSGSHDARPAGRATSKRSSSNRSTTTGHGHIPYTKCTSRSAPRRESTPWHVSTACPRTSGRPKLGALASLSALNPGSSNSLTPEADGEGDHETHHTFTKIFSATALRDHSGRDSRVCCAIAVLLSTAHTCVRPRAMKPRLPQIATRHACRTVRVRSETVELAFGLRREAKYMSGLT